MQRRVCGLSSFLLPLLNVLHYFQYNLARIQRQQPTTASFNRLLEHKPTLIKPTSPKPNQPSNTLDQFLQDRAEWGVLQVC